MTMTDTRTTETATPQADTSITLPYSTDLLGGIFAVAQHASKDAMSPVLTTVQVGTRHFVATDRYTVGEWEHTTIAESEARHGYSEPTNPDLKILVPRSAAEWLAKQTFKVFGFVSQSFADNALEIVFASDSITVRYADGVLNADSDRVVAIQRFNPIGGNFPPVARLFPAENGTGAYSGAGLVSLGPDHLDKLIKGIKRAGVKNESIRFQLTAADNPNKPGPVVATFGTRFRALVQPNLIIR